MWTFKHAAQEPLERAAKPALQGLLMLLENGMNFPTIMRSALSAFRAFMQSAAQSQRMYRSHHCMPERSSSGQSRLLCRHVFRV